MGLDGAANVLEAGIAQVLTRAGTPATSAGLFGLPAYGENAAIASQLEALPACILGHAWPLRQRHDCGWAGSLACADGINLIAGTGSMGYGQRLGNGARADGWGDLLGDEGSAYWIAVRGLNVYSK